MTQVFYLYILIIIIIILEIDIDEVLDRYELEKRTNLDFYYCIYVKVIYIVDYVGKCGIEYLSTKLRNMTNLTSLNLECIFLFVFYKLYSE